MQADDIGLSDLLAMTLPPNEEVEQLRGEANDLVIELIDRAKAAGKLRRDFVGEDLLLLLMANAAVVHVTRVDVPDASRRLVSLFLQAVGQRPKQLPLSEAPSSDQMRQAMARLASSRGCAHESTC